MCIDRNKVILTTVTLKYQLKSALLGPIDIANSCLRSPLSDDEDIFTSLKRRILK